MEVRPWPQDRRRRFKADLYKFVTLARVRFSPTRKRAHVLANHWALWVKSRPTLCFRGTCAAGAGRLFRTGPTSRVLQRREEPDRALDETDSGTYKRASVGPAVSSRAQTRFARRPDIAPQAFFREGGVISGHQPRRETAGVICFADAAYELSREFELVFEMVRDAGAAH
jgi:hypothetical protein